MKTKTLSALCIFALLSVNLASGSVIKRGLDENNVINKKNLVEIGTECTTGIDAETTATITHTTGTGVPPPNGQLPGNQGAGTVVAETSGVLVSIGEEQTTLPSGAQEKNIDCSSHDSLTGNDYACGVACAKKSYCFCGSVDYSNNRCVTENNHQQSQTTGQQTTICTCTTSNVQVGATPSGSVPVCAEACLVPI